MMGCEEYVYEGQFIADAGLADGRETIVKVDILPDVLPLGPSPFSGRSCSYPIQQLAAVSVLHCFRVLNVLKTWCVAQYNNSLSCQVALCTTETCT